MYFPGDTHSNDCASWEKMRLDESTHKLCASMKSLLGFVCKEQNIESVLKQLWSSNYEKEYYLTK